jgi:predicted nucleic acid-binding protein
VNLPEIEAGLRQRERRKVLGHPRFLVTTPEADQRAGRYQPEWGRQGRRVETPDALAVGTARTHGAMLLTPNTADFPMRGVRVRHPDEVDA